ncbi:MAG TPA: hypothetical protein VKB42_02795 [Dongiaceae bacterium]|nr:hypothetical protein [Dongiaceae bacterium]
MTNDKPKTQAPTGATGTTGATGATSDDKQKAQALEARVAALEASGIAASESRGPRLVEAQALEPRIAALEAQVNLPQQAEKLEARVAALEAHKAAPKTLAETVDDIVALLKSNDGFGRGPITEAIARLQKAGATGAHEAPHAAASS